MSEPIVQPPARRGLVFALLVTLAALPLLVWLVDREGAIPSAPPTTGDATQVVAPSGRATTGPPKGVSVVTTSTTSSTLPLTTTTTSTTVVVSP